MEFELIRHRYGPGGSRSACPGSLSRSGKIMRVRPRSGSTTVRETVPHIYRHTHTHLNCTSSVPAIVLRLVVDIVRVQNGVGDPGHEAVHPAAPVLVRPRDVIQGLRNVEEDVVDAVENYGGLGGQQRGQGQRQQLTPEKKKISVYRTV
jgi:hypothetical protein